MYFYLFDIQKKYKSKRTNSLIHFLQVQGNKYIFYQGTDNKSAFLFSQSCINGSMTLEAALILPVFFMVIVSICYLFVIMNYQNVIQINVNNTAKKIARYEYVMENLGELTEEEIDDNKANIDKDLLINGINIGYAWKNIYTENVRKYTKTAGVMNGGNGIEMTSSNIGKSANGYNDLIIRYRIGVDTFGKKKYYFRLGNRCVFRGWIGKSIDNKNQITSQEVYITKTGSVYHLYKQCGYINIVVSSVKYEDINDLRNSSGKKYSQCGTCIKKQEDIGDTLYITGSGHAYHSKRDCSSINRDVITIDIKNIGSRQICTRCEEKYINEG